MVFLDKILLRKKLLEKRRNMNTDDIKEKNKLIKERLYDSGIYKNSKFIMAYIDFRNEVETKEIIKYSLKLSKRIGVPISIPKTRELIISELFDFDKELENGVYNILTPKKEFIREISPKEIDLVLVPAVAFDRKGYRIGYGGGYYDRFFEKLDSHTIKLGLAFDIQIIPEVPAGKYDLPVDYVITNKELINCKDPD